MNMQKHPIILGAHIIKPTAVVPLIPTSSHLVIAEVNKF